MLGRELLLGGSTLATYWFSNSDVPSGPLAVGPSGEVFTTNSERNADGTVAWQNTLTGAAAGQTSVASDSSGNSYVLTYVSSQTQLIKFSPTGAVLWAKRLTSTAAFRPISSSVCTVDSAGNVIVVVGRFVSGSGFFGVVMKFSPTGTLAWAMQASTTGEYYGVTTDSSNNVYIGGQSGNYFVVAKLNSAGTLQFRTPIAFSSGTITSAIAVPSSGEIYAIGSVIGGGGLYNSGVMVKLSSAGAILYSRSIGYGSTGTVANGVAVGSDGSVYLGGFVSGSFRNIVIKYDSAGTTQWIREWYSTNSTQSVTGGSCIASSSYITVSAAVVVSGVGITHIGRIPLDGSLTKTTGPFVYGTNATITTGNAGVTFATGAPAYTLSSVSAAITVTDITPTIGSNSNTYTVYPL